MLGDGLRFLCFIVGVLFAAATVHLIRDPKVKSHSTFRGFRVRLFAMAVGVVATVLLQYQRLGEPVHPVSLGLSIVHLGLAFYSVWLPVSDTRGTYERKLHDQ